MDPKLRGGLLIGALVAVYAGATVYRGGTGNKLERLKRDAAQQAPKGPPANALRVLFIGNSYVYTNDLPGMIGSLAKGAKVERPLYAESFTPGGFTFDRHLKGGGALTQLGAGPWDVVVLQDQSQRFSFDEWQRKKEIYPPARELHAKAAAAKARVLFFLTWGYLAGDKRNRPKDDYASMQDRLDAGYASIAKQTGGEVVPVGPAWRAAVAKRFSQKLWSSDGSHPARHGTYLAACVFFQSLYDRSPVGNPYLAGLPEADARALQEIAAGVKGWRR